MYAPKQYLPLVVNGVAFAAASETGSEEAGDTGGVVPAHAGKGYHIVSNTVTN